MKGKMQLRGNCQHCGRDHAVVRGGYMAKHGYEVKNGYFNGVCQGDRAKSMQVDRAVADAIAVALKSNAVKLYLRADELETGREVLGMVEKPNSRIRRNDGSEPEKVEWSSLDKWDQQHVLRGVVHNIRQHAKGLTDFADDLVAIADKVHGQPLREVERQDAPAPVLVGESRISGGGDTLTVRYVEGGRVYWTRGNGRHGWTGVQAWRKLKPAG